jgi:signal transduction histidine kinase
MSNLISNAVKYAAGHAVKVRLKVLAGNACLEVEDQGTGIPLEAQKRIFDRFERATDGRHISGLGLGLYIARQIVETHGGKISLESEPGRGSCFKVLIPLLASKNSN